MINFCSKKTLFFISFLSVFFIFSSITSVNAACSWELLGNSGCLLEKTSSTNENCAGAQPSPVVVSHKSIYYGCCCDNEKSVANVKKAEIQTTKLITEDNAATVAKTTTALFTIPDFQVKIPGLDRLATVTCTTDQECNIPWIGQYIAGIYDYALAIVGILAAIVLMAGGLMWLISAGDASKITQAKELIIGSISGLIILIASYALLVTINPDLVNLKGVNVASIKRVDVEPVSYDGNPNNSRVCDNCISLKNIIPCKNNCQVNAILGAQLTAAALAPTLVPWRITEAYPWTSEHASKCHYNGTCVDLALTGAKATCSDVDKVIAVLKMSGLSVLNEYTNCGGTKTDHTTGGHLHVRMLKL